MLEWFRAKELEGLTGQAEAGATDFAGGGGEVVSRGAPGHGLEPLRQPPHSRGQPPWNLGFSNPVNNGKSSTLKQHHS